jgi:hypothetical protein
MIIRKIKELWTNNNEDVNYNKSKNIVTVDNSNNIETKNKKYSSSLSLKTYILSFDSNRRNQQTKIEVLFYYYFNLLIKRTIIIIIQVIHFLVQEQWSFFSLFLICIDLFGDYLIRKKENSIEKSFFFNFNFNFNFFRKTSNIFKTMFSLS